MVIRLDMYQTLAIAVVVLLFGQFLKHKISFLEKFCVPAPVVGGLLFAIFTCICYSLGIAEFDFDGTLVWQLFKTPHRVSGKILYSCPCHWRSFVCNFDLSLLCYRNCEIFF